MLIKTNSQAAASNDKRRRTTGEGVLTDKSALHGVDAIKRRDTAKELEGYSRNLRALST